MRERGVDNRFNARNAARDFFPAADDGASCSGLRPALPGAKSPFRHLRAMKSLNARRKLAGHLESKTNSKFMNMKSVFQKKLGALLICAGLAAAQSIHAQTNLVSGVLPAGTNSWWRTNVYQLNGAVFVLSNSVLNIEAGTVIKGHNLGSFGTNVGALYVCRGAKIYAEGTPQNPILFTAEKDDLSLPDDLGLWERGVWGGVVIFGNTPINGALDPAGNAATPKYEVYEGLDPNLNFNGEYPFRFGGNDDNDNSGILRYVSIRHGGAKLSTDKEINGLSLGAVGRGTTIEFVEAYAIADDGFEFFGGTVNTKYLVSAFCDDDSFDVDMGFRGTNQFWFAIQAPDARNYGGEWNNQINELVTTNLLTPQADFQLYNATFIGSGTANTSVTGGRNAAFILRPYVAPKVYNSIFTDYNERAIELDTRQGVNAAVSVTNGFAQFHNTLWWGFVTGSGSGVVDNSIANLARNTVASNYWTDTSLTNLIADPLLMGISRSNFVTILDPRPANGSPAYSSYAPAPGGWKSVAYVGAFGAGRGNWAADWTALNEYNVLSGAGGINPFAAASAAVVLPDAVTISLALAGANVIVTHPSQTGYNYQLLSATNLTPPVTWANEGAAQPGTGGTLTNTVPASGPGKFLRVLAQ